MKNRGIVQNFAGSLVLSATFAASTFGITGCTLKVEISSSEGQSLLSTTDGDPTGTEGNEPPLVQGPTSITILPGDTKRVSFSAADPDGDAFTLSLDSTLPSYASVDSSNPGVLIVSFAPGASDSGHSSLKIKAKDASGATSFLTVDVNIFDGGVTPTNPALAHFYYGPVSETRKQELDQLITASTTLPATGHPRLFGSDAEWYARTKKFDAVNADCSWKGTNAWGAVKNTKALWDASTLGGEVCAHKVPTSLSVHPDAKYYLDPANTFDPKIKPTWWSTDRRIRVLFLIRKMYACHKAADPCPFPKADVDKLSESFLNYEFARQRAEVKNDSGYFPSWHNGWTASFFDLGALPVFKFWCLVLDTFWDNSILKSADKSFITAELDNEIDSYLTIFELPENSSGYAGRWALWNGNNWTSVLNGAALYYAITFWHENNTKARKILGAILKTGWLHRDLFLADGAYSEGPSYYDVTMNGLLDQNELLKASFGQPLHNIPWQHIGTKTNQWLIDNVASDSLLIDFGDTWDKAGYGMLYFLQVQAWEEFVGLKSEGSTPFSTSADGCLLKAFFTNNYYDYHFNDPWRVTPVLARDYQSLVNQCQPTSSGSLLASVYSFYQLATLRSFLPGATVTATTGAPSLIRTQADQTLLALNAVDNSLPHREIDFGALIWTAFGNRLISDWGYGELSSTYKFYDTPGNKGRFVKTSDADTLEFYIKQIDKTIDPAKFKISITVHYITKDVLLSKYLTSVPTTWTKVSIPLKDFGMEESRWTSIRGDAGDPWATPGLEFITFTTLGAVSGGLIGFDEVKLVSANTPSSSVVWYGETHSTVTDPGARYESSPSLFYLVGEETTGGANSTSKWMKLSASNSGRLFRMFYSSDPNEFVVANTMDYLPVGANTLVLPNAHENGVLQTQMSQFKGEKGTLNEFSLNGYSGLVMDGSIVYGSARADGNLEYFFRYAFSLNNGNYAVLDSFKAKAGKEDLIQEFWYSKADMNPEHTNCTSGTMSSDVFMSLENSQTLLLEPKCNTISRNGAAVESAGRVIGASMQPGDMVYGAPSFFTGDPFFKRFVSSDGKIVKLKNRLNNWDGRRIGRYVPRANVSEDVRIFLLQAAPGKAKLPTASVQKISCGADKVCFKIIDGSKTIQVTATKQNGQYKITGID